MNEHTATELAYKNGFAKGFADGKGEPISCGHEKGGEWISVNERLPEECTHVIVHDEDGTVGEAFHSISDHFEWVANEKIAFVTHWMPLPEPPKGE